MKVLVINPGVNRARKPLQRPGGPMSIAEYLIDRGIDCKFLELSGTRISKRLVHKLALPSGTSYDFLLLSIMGGEFVPRALTIARLWKSISPGTIIAAGGHFVTHHLAPRPHLWKQLPMDIWIRGGGEWLMPEIFNQYSQPPGEPVLLEGQTGELDSLPPPCTYLPAHDYISWWDGYLPGKRTFQITTSRGCPYGCGFCHLNSGYERKQVSGMSAERVIDVCQYLVRRYRIGGFYFVDDLFSYDVNRLHRFCRLKTDNPLLNRVPFFGDFRTTDFSCKRVDPALLVKAGLTHVYLGFESGSDRIMDKIGKDGSLQHHITAIEMLKKYDVRITGSFIVGFPFETVEDLKQTIGFIQSQPLDYWEVHVNGATWNDLEKEPRGDETLPGLIRLSHWGELPAQSPPAVARIRQKLLQFQHRPGAEMASIFKLILKGV